MKPSGQTWEAALTGNPVWVSAFVKMSLMFLFWSYRHTCLIHVYSPLRARWRHWRCLPFPPSVNISALTTSHGARTGRKILLEIILQPISCRFQCCFNVNRICLLKVYLIPPAGPWCTTAGWREAWCNQNIVPRGRQSENHGFVSLCSAADERFDRHTRHKHRLARAAEGKMGNSDSKWYQASAVGNLRG